MGAMSGAAPLVLVIGDANPDLILTGDIVPRFGQSEQLLASADLVIGGAAAVTAHALARLGRPVRLVAAVGCDDFGDRIRSQLHDAGVDMTALSRRDNVPTGLTVVLAHPDDRAILTLPGAVQSLTADEARRAINAVASGPLHVHVSSLFLQPDLARELPAVLAEARQRGVTTSLDTNDDPAGRWSGVSALLPHLDLLLPNRSEVLALAGPGTTDPITAARTLSAAGPLVVVKDGARGAIAVRPGGEVCAVGAEPVTAIDTTGAGDTFDAAFIDAWLDGRELRDCLHRAVLAGAAAVGALGGTAGQPTSACLTSREGTR